jgi:hypothetical protein
MTWIKEEEPLGSVMMSSAATPQSIVEESPDSPQISGSLSTTGINPPVTNWQGNLGFDLMVPKAVKSKEAQVSPKCPISKVHCSGKRLMHDGLLENLRILKLIFV